MYISFDQMPETSRIWIYQSTRPFTSEEMKLISTNAINFINGWVKHGEDLKGSFIVKYNQFFVMAVDEAFNQVSGCSIDASVRFVKDLEKQLGLDLLDKLKITFKDGDNINIITLSDFQTYAKEGKITNRTVVFNNMVQTKKELETSWEVTANLSWHNRFLS